MAALSLCPHMVFPLCVNTPHSKRKSIIALLAGLDEKLREETPLVAYNGAQEDRH